MQRVSRLLLMQVVLIAIELLLLVCIITACEYRQPATSSRLISDPDIKFSVERLVVRGKHSAPISYSTGDSVEETSQDPIALYNSYIDEICTHYDNLDPDLIRAVVWVESRYDPNAVNYNGTCIGLMQISTKWHTARAESLGVSLEDPYGNLLTGCDLLSELIYTYKGDISYALMVYNMGYSGANRLHSQGKVSSYVLAVNSRHQELKGVYT